MTPEKEKELAFLHQLAEDSMDKTVGMMERVTRSAFYEEPDPGESEEGEKRYGKFKGRDIIARDAKINGGVYLSSSSQEAIVVDDVVYPEELNEIYEHLVDNVRETIDAMRRHPTLESYIMALLQDVYNEVCICFTSNDVQTAEAIGRPYKNDQEIPLNEFIKQKAGVCKQCALLGAYLIERLMDENRIPGLSVSVDRNYVRGAGGHAWVRFTAVEEGGKKPPEVYVIDAAQNFVGRLRDVPKEGWFYLRPEDVDQLRKEEEEKKR